MRKVLLLLLVMWLAIPAGGSADEIGAVKESIRPGKAALLGFTLDEAGAVDLCLEDEQGNEISVVVLGFDGQKGFNQVYWNGTYGGVPVPAGEYKLVLSGEEGKLAETAVTVGSVAPYLTAIRAESLEVTPEKALEVSFYAGEDGRITTGVRQGNEWQQVASWAVSAGENSLTWDAKGMVVDGEVAFTMMLTDENGESSTEEHLNVVLSGFAPEEEIPVVPPETDEAEDEPEGEAEGEASAPVAEVNDQSQYTPTYGSPYAGQDTSMNYWTLPMDITNEAAIWDMLMQPVTVLDNGKKKAERTQVVIRQEPDEESLGIGVVTCKTQSVHVLEKGEEWTLIECYSSSFKDSPVWNWNTLVQGYVPTKYLETVVPDQTMGLVVDKLTQRLYIFREGKLYDTLLVSTGIANAKQPFNETRSGEFLLQDPAVGEFRSDNMYCSMGIRFNDGDLLHELPHNKLGDGGKNYKPYEPKLGTKASHGCIRVQRLKTPLGTNMSWLWNHREDEMKVVIWEDWQGRQIPYPDDDMALYYNPKGGTMYHTAEKCSAAKNRTFTPFTYGELEDEAFAKLKRCSYCVPPLRKAEIDEINAQYAPGGDHDPVMTKARHDAQVELGLIAD